MQQHFAQEEDGSLLQRLVQVWGSGFRVYGSGFRVWGFEFGFCVGIQSF